MQNPKHGGARPGSGPKPIYGKKLNRIVVYVNDEQLAFAELIGKGNLSDGVRKAIDLACDFIRRTS